MDRGPQRSPSRPKKFGRIDPFCWIPVVSLVTIAALMIVSGAAPIGAALVGIAALLLLFDSWVNRPDPEAESGAARTTRPPARRPARPESRPRPPRAEPSRGANPPPPPMRNRPPQQPQPRMDGRPVTRQVPPPPPRRPGPRSGAGA